MTRGGERRRRERRRVATAIVVASAVFGVLLGLRPLPVERLLGIYVLVLAAIAVASLARGASAPEDARHRSPLEEALRARPDRPPHPPELVRAQRELTLGMASAAHAHRRLLPLLREAAAARLAAGYGVELARRPESARALLGDEAWELLRPDRPGPDDLNAPGLRFAQVEAVVARLESL